MIKIIELPNGRLLVELERDGDMALFSDNVKRNVADCQYVDYTEVKKRLTDFERSVIKSIREYNSPVMAWQIFYENVKLPPITRTNTQGIPVVNLPKK